MKILAISILILFVLCLIVYFAYRLGSKKRTSTNNVRFHQMPIQTAPTMNKVQIQHADTEDFGSELTIKDQRGETVMSSHEISGIPQSARKLTSTNGVVQLAADLFKGSTSIPNKTIELVFKKEILEGLENGTYTLMKTKGEVLADAIDSTTRKIVGKARVVESGKLRQVAAGAFQLVSIVVAQSHLADIEHSLRRVEGSIAELLSNLENEDKAQLTGAIHYLSDVAGHIAHNDSPEKLSQEKIHNIETISYQSNIWRNKLFEDFSSRINTISNQVDEDRFGGTENTYNSLKNSVEKVKPIVDRYELLIHLSGLTNFIMAYIDPTQKRLTRIDPQNDIWETRVKEFKEVADKKSEEHLSKALFNSDEILKFRRIEIQDIASKHSKNALDQMQSYKDGMSKLNHNLKKFLGNDDELNIAISFDQKGEVRDAAIIEKT